MGLVDERRQEVQGPYRQGPPRPLAGYGLGIRCLLRSARRVAIRVQGAGSTIRLGFGKSHTTNTAQT